MGLPESRQAFRPRRPGRNRHANLHLETRRSKTPRRLSTVLSAAGTSRHRLQCRCRTSQRVQGSLVMKLSPEHIARLEAFFDKIRSQTYPEPISDLHGTITAQMLDAVFRVARIPAQARVLDVGCGQGVALEQFIRMGLKPVGITINPVDIQAC